MCVCVCVCVWLHYNHNRDESPKDYAFIDIAMSKIADKCHSTYAYPLIGYVYSTYCAFLSVAMLYLCKK